MIGIQWLGLVLQVSIFNRFFLVVASSSEVCWDKFDLNYRNQCMNGNWQQRFYFDHASLTCRQFWYDGCRSDSRNVFDDLLTCQWLCETQPMYKSRACLQDFDVHYKDQCNGGRWRQQFYFDRNVKVSVITDVTMDDRAMMGIQYRNFEIFLPARGKGAKGVRCIPFWYDGCTGESENLFQDEQSCLITCENPAKKDPRKPWHGADKIKMKAKLEDMYKPNLTDICATANPCQNNGTCIFVWKKNMHYCKCDKGYMGADCSQKIDIDPCASGPCKNGATCAARVEKNKTSYECVCASGYAGPHCDQKPCDVNPCLHNGTCRTTAGYSAYFCDCMEGYGGKNCDIFIGSITGSAPPEETYGSNVMLVSSGKVEWIQQMKERLGGTKPEAAAAPAADAPYKSPAAKKLEREEREKKEAELRDKEQNELEEKRKKMEKRMEEERLRNEDLRNVTLQLKASTFSSFLLSFSIFLLVQLVW